MICLKNLFQKIPWFAKKRLFHNKWQVKSVHKKDLVSSLMLLELCWLYFPFTATTAPTTCHNNYMHEGGHQKTRTTIHLVTQTLGYKTQTLEKQCTHIETDHTKDTTVLLENLEHWLPIKPRCVLLQFINKIESLQANFIRTHQTGQQCASLSQTVLANMWDVVFVVTVELDDLNHTLLPSEEYIG